MANVKIYTTHYCPHCTRAKKLLEGKSVEFDEIDIGEDPDARAAVQSKTGWMTVPMIFIGEEFIGGADELFALESAGQLDEKLSNG